MHILITNDDGPPNPASSPYISTFISVLCSPPHNHTVSVILPTTQRSWIGKAHLLPPSSFPVGGQSKNDDITDVIRPVYYDPLDGTTHPSPATLRTARSTKKVAPANGASAHPQAPPANFPEYYVLIPGTPSACAQFGLFHHSLLFPDDSSSSGSSDSATSAYNPDTVSKPIDLLLSGPNYGRNTTAAFALSSGTIGGALEGAICGVRAIALSFGFFTRTEPEAVVREASELGVRIAEALVREWDSGSGSERAAGGVEGSSGGSSEEEKRRNGDRPDLYSVNVPLVEGVSRKSVRWTWMLGNKWATGSLYKAIGRGGEASEADGAAQANGVGPGNGNGNGKEDASGDQQPPMFKWSPTFGDVWKTVEQSAPGNDGLVIRERCTSVTPLKANFRDLYGLQGLPAR